MLTDGPIGLTALLNIDLGGARTEPWRGPGGRQQCRGAWQRQPLRQRQCATSDSFAAATLLRCCDDACVASNRGVSSIFQTQDQCPSLASARAVGGGTPLSHGGFQPPLDDSTGALLASTASNPVPLPRACPCSTRACLDPLSLDSVGCCGSQ